MQLGLEQNWHRQESKRSDQELEDQEEGEGQELARSEVGTE